MVQENLIYVHYVHVDSFLQVSTVVSLKDHVKWEFEICSLFNQSGRDKEKVREEIILPKCRKMLIDVRYNKS